MIYSLPVIPEPYFLPINPCLDRREQEVAYRKLLLERDPALCYCGCFISRKKRWGTSNVACRGKSYSMRWSTVGD